MFALFERMNEAVSGGKRLQDTTVFPIFQPKFINVAEQSLDSCRLAMRSSTGRQMTFTLRFSENGKSVEKEIERDRATVVGQRSRDSRRTVTWSSPDYRILSLEDSAKIYQGSFDSRRMASFNIVLWLSSDQLLTDYDPTVGRLFDASAEVAGIYLFIYLCGYKAQQSMQLSSDSRLSHLDHWDCWVICRLV